MDALVKITAHPLFGRFVKTVIISCYRPDIRPPVGHSDFCHKCRRTKSEHSYYPVKFDHAVLGSDQLCARLDESFGNLSKHSGAVTIGVYDTTEGALGSMQYLANNRVPLGVRWCETEHDYLLNETYKQVVRAARKSGCKIDGVRVGCFGTEKLPSMDLQLILDPWSRDFFTSMTEPLNFHLRCDERYSMPQNLHYYCDTKRLFLQRHDFSHDWDDHDLVGYMRSALSWLATQSVTCVRILSTDFSAISDLQPLLSCTLSSLRLCDVTVHTTQLATNLWSKFLSDISQLNGLTYLELDRLYYGYESVTTTDG